MGLNVVTFDLRLLLGEISELCEERDSLEEWRHKSVSLEMFGWDVLDATFYVPVFGSCKELIQLDEKEIE